MIFNAVRCDKESFKEVRFKRGFNVILAERTVTATKKDSRNGAGKTTLIEIIHFCLGASTTKDEGLRVKELENWTFILDVTLNGKNYSIHRNTLDFSTVKIAGDVSGWPIKPICDDSQDKYLLTIKDWNILLGFLVFGIPPEALEMKYSTTFRSLISFFMRRGVGAFQSPFKHYAQQKEWDIQVNNGFLLGLNWEYASEFQVLKDNDNTLKELKKAANQGLLTGYVGTTGQLQTDRITLEDDIRQLDGELKTFKVHPQYYKIQEETNNLTKKLHDLANLGTLNHQILGKYTDSIVQEQDVAADKVKKIYEEAGFVFPDGVVKKLDEVSTFHHQLMENRKEYLQTEMERISRDIEDQNEQIQQLSNQRAGLMEILQTHGALEEFSKLQERVLELKQQLEEVKNRLENLKRFEEGKSTLKIQKGELYQKTRRDFEERLPHVEKAIRMFNLFSEALYKESGRLSIDITETGYRFNVEIKQTTSQGIGYMKVFCYDLMLVHLLSELNGTSSVLVHDSTIFDGVDERQVAKALELAAFQAEAEKNQVQYICALNSDNVPYNDFSKSFKNSFEEHVITTFSDATDNGGLLGIRF